MLESTRTHHPLVVRAPNDVARQLGRAISRGDSRTVRCQELSLVAQQKLYLAGRGGSDRFRQRRNYRWLCFGLRLSLDEDQPSTTVDMLATDADDV